MEICVDKKQDACGWEGRLLHFVIKQGFPLMLLTHLKISIELLSTECDHFMDLVAFRCIVLLI